MASGLFTIGLIVLERDLSSKLWNSLEDLVLLFAQKHKNSRIVLLQTKLYPPFCLTLLLDIINNNN